MSKHFFLGYILYKEKNKVMEKQGENKSINKRSAKNTSIKLNLFPNLFSYGFKVHVIKIHNSCV